MINKEHIHGHGHDYLLKDTKIKSNEKKTLLVVMLTFVTMIVEITFGYLTGSMALLADGWHMASHVGALGISLLAYKLARSTKMGENYSFGTGKFVPLGGYTSAIMLGFVAIIMAVESSIRLMNPVEIEFSYAIIVSVVGLIVNIVSALILSDSHDHHHDHESHGSDHVHDHNHQSALVHVIADALTSVLAIFALLLGKYFGWNWADPMMGIVGSAVILKWAYGLCKATIWELLDGKSKAISEKRVYDIFSDVENMEIVDLHIWRVAPNAHACELMVSNKDALGSEFYRKRMQDEFSIEHLIVEERTHL